jgi:hypothetical protein
MIVFAVSTAIWLVSSLLIRSTAPADDLTSSTSHNQECADLLAQPLAEIGLPGQVSFLLEGTVHIQLSYSLPEGSPEDTGAQAIWSIFDIAAGLPESCPFRMLDIGILSGSTSLQASVNQDDLQAWSQGLLGDADLVERVSYHQVTSPPQ